MEEWIMQAFTVIAPFCDKDELHGIKNRLNSTSDETFSQGVSELVVAKYFIERWPNGIYLPRSKTKKTKNIDVSFLCNEQRINIEVKAPDLSFEKQNQFTVVAPYQFSDSEERKRLINSIVGNMGGNLNVVPNKILNVNKFIDECEKKFAESSEVGDINIVLFSMQDPCGMDDYRIKLEDEKLLSGYSLIHAVVLSNAAMRHQRNQSSSAGGLEKSFNYVIKNLHSDSSITNEQLSSAISCIHHETDEARAWFEEQIRGQDALFVFALAPQRLKHFNLSR